MHVTAHMARWGQKLHHWEHDFLISSGKVIHKNETMGAIVILALVFLGFVLFTVFAYLVAGPAVPPGPYYY